MDKVKKAFSGILILFISAVFLAACGAETADDSTSGEGSDDVLKVGFVTGTAGLGDKSFNDISHEGALKAEEELGIELTVVEPGDLSAVPDLLRKLVQNGSDLIITVGFDMAESLAEVATESPDTKFAVIDATIDLPNVQSLVFSEHEGSFLIGALAGLMTETNQVGQVPANDVPFLNRFAHAYEEGVKYTNPDAEVITQYIGSGMDSFNNPGEMKSIALSQYSKGVDIIYPIAGGSGTGLFEAIKETEKYGFGINTDQDDEVPGHILTSMVKACDVAIYDSIKNAVDGTFEAGVYEYGLDNEGIRLTDMRHTQDLIGEENINTLKEIEESIISGDIEVTDITDSE